MDEKPCHGGLDKWAESEEYESGKGQKNQIEMSLSCLSDLGPQLDTWALSWTPGHLRAPTTSVAKVDLPQAATQAKALPIRSPFSRCSFSGFLRELRPMDQIWPNVYFYQ